MKLKLICNLVIKSQLQRLIIAVGVEHLLEMAAQLLSSPTAETLDDSDYSSSIIFPLHYDDTGLNRFFSSSGKLQNAKSRSASSAFQNATGFQLSVLERRPFVIDVTTDTRPHAV